jgi:hypothetical protein
MADLPWRQVVQIEHQTGPRGGESWWLTLDCGHHKAVPIPRYRPELDMMPVFHGSRPKRRRALREAPHRCKCLLCALDKSALLGAEQPGGRNDCDE